MTRTIEDLQRLVKERAAHHRGDEPQGEQGEDMSEHQVPAKQQTFGFLMSVGVEHDWNRDNADTIDLAIQRASALLAMAKQAKVQPIFADKVHAITRAADMALVLGSALQRLQVEINGDDEG